jgi:hypothetical protein
MVTIYTATDPKDLLLVEMILRDSGIEFQIANENAAATLGMGNPAVQVQFQVRHEDAEAAMRTIQGNLRKMRLAHSRSTQAE